ncbi:uncharacterized protein F5891DRAFT_981560 [Suillus fuscotomentosus]|uniref:Uncharacterized protein n=1 Tax=Suillus fuscotomentosus TaxID=1912939 RepID=A0AAD4E435_9AGAM|nr:uncharacterized protein F5891DRAFT_981560 [Suillus fuscotomentosus]KAG1898906.1 hypothetical protein F5891DRAFT_981560 [Suillus fuscotomentosus]
MHHSLCHSLSNTSTKESVSDRNEELAWNGQGMAEAVALSLLNQRLGESSQKIMQPWVVVPTMAVAVEIPDEEASREQDFKGEHLKAAVNKPSVRESWTSELPGGGYFRSATHQGSAEHETTLPSSPSKSYDGNSSSLTETESEPESEGERQRSRRKKRKKKKDWGSRQRIKKAMTGVSIKTPFVWSGRADLDVFDHGAMK